MRQMRTRHIRPLLLRKVGLHTVMGWLWATSFMWNLRDGNWPEKILHQGHLLLQFNIQSWISQQLPVKLKRHVSKLVIGKSLLLRVQNLNKAGHLRPSGHIRPSGILDVNTVANGSMEKSHLSGIALTVLRAHHSTMGDVVLGKKLWYKFRACWDQCKVPQHILRRDVPLCMMCGSEQHWARNCPTILHARDTQEVATQTEWHDPQIETEPSAFFAWIACCVTRR